MLSASSAKHDPYLTVLPHLEVKEARAKRAMEPEPVYNDDPAFSPSRNLTLAARSTPDVSPQTEGWGHGTQPFPRRNMPKYIFCQFAVFDGFFPHRACLQIPKYSSWQVFYQSYHVPYAIWLIQLSNYHRNGKESFRWERVITLGESISLGLKLLCAEF